MKTKTLSSPVGQLIRLKSKPGSAKAERGKSTKLTCKEIAKHICGELDEHINSTQCRKIKKHLQDCPNCTAYLDSMKKTVALYRVYPNPKVSERCRKNLFAVLKLQK